MKVCGIIAEYDPFHKGHAYHLRAAREATRADYVVCVISGSFTQRGAPALLPASVRAEMALRCGADAVLQMPYAFSVREADAFALGGTVILARLQCVDFLSFGCETADISLLNAAAGLLEAPDEDFSRVLRGELDKGLSFAAAQGKALENAFGMKARTLTQPNAALGVCYLRALRRLNSPIVPVPILREGAYHAAEVHAVPSAQALRQALLRGNWQAAEAAIPEEAMPVLERAALDGLLLPPERMDALTRAALLNADAETLRRVPGIDEGLEMRILKASRHAADREALIAAVKTRRYTRGRISRALCHLTLGIRRNELPQAPGYARLLGFREEARPLLRRMAQSGFPLVTRPARCPEATLDVRADETRAVVMGLPLRDVYRQKPVIIAEKPKKMAVPVGTCKSAADML